MNMAPETDATHDPLTAPYPRFSVVRGSGWQSATTTWSPYGRRYAIYRDDRLQGPPTNPYDDRLVRTKSGAVRTFASHRAAEIAATKLL